MRGRIKRAFDNSNSPLFLLQNKLHQLPTDTKTGSIEFSYQCLRLCLIHFPMNIQKSDHPDQSHDLDPQVLCNSASLFLVDQQQRILFFCQNNRCRLPFVQDNIEFPKEQRIVVGINFDESGFDLLFQKIMRLFIDDNFFVHFRGQQHQPGKTVQQCKLIDIDQRDDRRTIGNDHTSFSNRASCSLSSSLS